MFGIFTVRQQKKYCKKSIHIVVFNIADREWNAG